MIVLGTRDKSEFYKPCVEWTARIETRSVRTQSFAAGHSVDLDSKQATAAILAFLE
ncbi:MAG: hypothetical protein R3D85_10045 [Paracoccaceae bacterium]